jgi:hypothetical protein
MTELSIDKIKKEILKLGGKLLEFTLKEKDGDCSNFEKITTEDYERNLYIKKYITRNYNLGRYDKIEDAAFARAEAEKKLFDDFLEWYAENHREQ